MGDGQLTHPNDSAQCSSKTLSSYVIAILGGEREREKNARAQHASTHRKCII